MDALQAAGLAPDGDLIFPGEGRAEDGRRALRRMWELTPRPDAVVCYNDLTAMGVLAEAWRNEIRVPDDLAVIGFDNLPFSELTAPPLTTVTQPTEEMGRAAVAQALRLRQGQDVEDVVFECTLVERESVKREA